MSSMNYNHETYHRFGLAHAIHLIIEYYGALVSLKALLRLILSIESSKRVIGNVLSGKSFISDGAKRYGARATGNPRRVSINRETSHNSFPSIPSDLLELGILTTFLESRESRDRVSN
ncbi:hypothetical protein Tco_0204708 [Tanacetum coccineum]